MSAVARSGSNPRRGAPGGADVSWRTVRGVVAGTTCGIGGAVAHALSGGVASLGGSALVAAIALVVCLVLARWPLTLPRLLIVAGAVQGCSHLVLATSASAPHASVPMQHGSAPMEHPGGASSMLLAHLLVAGVTALISRGADRELVSLARQLVDKLLPRHAATARPPLPPRRAGLRAVRLAPSRRRPVTPLSRRGPPIIGAPLLLTLP